MSSPQVLPGKRLSPSFSLCSVKLGLCAGQVSLVVDEGMEASRHA